MIEISRSSDEVTEVASWSELEADADSTVEEAAAPMELNFEEGQDDQAGSGTVAYELSIDMNVRLQINGPVMVPALESCEKETLPNACSPKKETKENWTKLRDLFGNKRKKQRAIMNGGTFNVKAKVLAIAVKVTSIGQPVILFTIAQKDCRATVVFWERHIPVCNLVVGDRVKFFEIEICKYYGGALQITNCTRIEKYKHTH